MNSDTQPKIYKNVDALIEIFEKTFADKTFSRGEKKAVLQLITQDFCLNKDQRSQARSKIFHQARKGITGHENLQVLDWLETANKLLLNRQDSRVFFSPGYQCRNEILERLEKATTAVDICVYTISDDQLAEAIANCHRRKVDLRIITDDEKINDRGSDIWELAAYGIPVKIDNSPHYMHHKFAIFDNRILLTGSYNWTRSAAEFNQENIIVTDDRHAVKGYKGEFATLWENMEFLKLPGFKVRG